MNWNATWFILCKEYENRHHPLLPGASAFPSLKQWFLMDGVMDIQRLRRRERNSRITTLSVQPIAVIKLKGNPRHPCAIGPKLKRRPELPPRVSHAQETFCDLPASNGTEGGYMD